METDIQVADTHAKRDVWGLAPPPGAQLWYGARAIYSVDYIEGRKGTRRRPGHRSHWEYTVDLVWDRQGFYRADGAEISGGEIDDLKDWINNRGMKQLRKLVKEEQLFRDEDRLIMFDDTLPANISKGRLSQTYTMQANPRQSHGYLYLCAWRKTG